MMKKRGWWILALVISSSLPSWAEEPLAQQLVSQDKATQKAAFEELARLGESGKQALVLPLINHVRQGSKSAIDALSRMGPVVIPETMPLLNDADPRARVAAMRILEEATIDRHRGGRDSTVIGPIVSALRKSLHDPERNVRHQTFVTLGHLHAKDALPDLIEALKDSDLDTRFEAAETITQIDLTVEQVVPVFAEALKDDELRWDAVESLSSLPEHVEEVSSSVKRIIPQLLPLLQDSEVNVRIAVAATLARFCGPENEEAVPTLTQALKKTDTILERGYLAQALEQIGSPKAKKAAKRYKPTREQLMREAERLLSGPPRKKSTSD